MTRQDNKYRIQDNVRPNNTIRYSIRQSTVAQEDKARKYYTIYDKIRQYKKMERKPM